MSSERTTVAINGFGRIGRLLARNIYTLNTKYHELLELTAINDPVMTTEEMIYLLKHDSVYGAFSGSVRLCGNNDIEINGSRVAIHHCANPSEVFWGATDFVLESSGKFTSGAQASDHLKMGAKKVIISAPAKDETPTYVMVISSPLILIMMMLLTASVSI